VIHINVRSSLPRRLAEPSCKKYASEFAISEVNDTIRDEMTKVEALEREIEKLTREELSAFREWFLEHDWRAWDRELEQDVADGKLDKFAAEAREEFKRGKTKEI